MSSSLRRRLKRARRGGATVELAVLLVVLVPLMMYTLFLEDMLYYNLEWQEAIVTPAWDYLPVDYSKGSAHTLDIQHLDRETFCDHTAAYNTYSNPGYDCDDTAIHHQALTAHQCWMVNEGLQVTCSLDNRSGLSLSPTYAPYNVGGLTSCTARLGVMNYFLVQKFFQWWSQRDTTRAELFTGDVHANAGHANSANAWVFGLRTPDYFGVVHDSWALDHLTPLSPQAPDPGHPLWDRTNTYFQTFASGAPANARSFAQALVSDRLLSSNAYDDLTGGDNPTTPQVGWKAEHTRTFNNHWASGWSDQRQQDTYSDREDSYFAVPVTTW